MKVTDVRIMKINSENKLRGMASITLDNDFVVNDIKILEAQNKWFIAMPSRKTPNGEYKDIAHPINKETRKKIEEAILDKYMEEK